MISLKSIFWCRSRPLLAPILEPHVGTRFAQEAAKINTEGHQELQRPKNSLFKTLKKHLVFTRFWVQNLPREPQETQEGSQEAPKELQNLKKNIKKHIEKIQLMVENALSRRSRFLDFLAPFLEP